MMGTSTARETPRCLEDAQKEKQSQGTSVFQASVLTSPKCHRARGGKVSVRAPK